MYSKSKFSIYLIVILSLFSCSSIEKGNDHSLHGRHPSGEHIYTVCKRALSSFYAEIKYRKIEATRSAIIIKGDESLKQRGLAIDYVDPIKGVSSARRQTAKLQKEWRKVQLKYFAKLWKENHIAPRNIELLQIAKNEGIKHPVDIWGEDTYKSWKSAVDHLDRIRKGDLVIDRELLLTVNKKVVGADRAIFKIINKVLPEKYWIKGGGIFRHADVVPTPDIITKEVQKKLEANEWLGSPGFIPLKNQPKGITGDRIAGYINYPDNREEALRKLDNLNSWANSELNKIRNAQEGAMDPIDLASRYQYRLVSIHPFLDGNGRSTRLFMDRILQEFDLPPPMFKENDWDIFYSEAEYSQKVRDAVLRSLYVHGKAYGNRHTNKWLTEAPNVYKINKINKINKKDTPITKISEIEIDQMLKEYKKHISETLQPKNMGSVFYLGGKNYAEKYLAIAARNMVIKFFESSRIITLKDVIKGKYFRAVADIIVDGESVSSHLLKFKLAVPYQGETKLMTGDDWLRHYQLNQDVIDYWYKLYPDPDSNGMQYIDGNFVPRGQVVTESQ
jgi:hypothetical protein